MHKYPTYAPRTEGANIILNSPPHASELSPIISGVKSASSASPMTYWANSQDPSAPYTSGSSMASTYTTDQSFMGRHPYSPIAKEGFMSSHYNHHPFTNHMSISGSGESHQQQQSLHHQHHQHHINVASQPPPQALSHGPQHAPENYGHPPISSSHYLPSLSLQQSNAFSSNPSAHHSPQNLSETSSQLPPVVGHGSGHSTMAAPASYHRQYGGGFNLPAMNGPILSHMQAPDAQMSMTSNVHMTPYSQQLGEPMYGSHSGQQQPQNDRPFKCDQCPQSFNRNHDLKRHRRIHLAIKPFPCVNCDKSFSRKDALKRHILVKSCGGAGKTPRRSAGDASLSPQNDVMSDSHSDHFHDKTRLL